METAQPPSRKLRKRSKSVSAKEEAPAATTEVAPDLNGDSDAKPNKGEEPESHVPALKEDKPKSEEENIKHVTQGRKRKASEMKDDADVETNIREIGDNKEKKEVTEPVHNAEEDKEKADKEDEKFEKSEEKEEPQEVPGDSKEIRLPPKQTLGKGKRARIPNKRYSDILLSPKAIHSDTESKSKKASLENGLVSESTVEKENISSESDSKFDMTGSQAISNIKRPSQASPASASKKPKVVVDLSNPNYLKPFKYGWKRELVYRASAMSDTSAKRNGDIYYYTPGGKKVRSMREVSENLKNKELSLDDFTFFKEPLGLDDPEKEIIRDAKFKSANVSALPRKSTPKAKAPKILSPKLSTSSPAVSPAIEASETETPKVKNSRLSSFKIKLSGSRGQSKQSKQEKKIKDEDMDVGTYPPNWQSPKKATKWTGKADTPKGKKATRASNIVAQSSKSEEGRYMDNYLQNLAYGYNTLLYVFQYLKVQDLLRAGCVCHMWRDIASHPILWRTVRMKNSQVHSFDGLADTLQKHGTVHLDLRKMLLPSSGDELWQSFSQAIKKVDSLRKIEFCRCPASVVEQLPSTNPKLEVINAVTIRCESMSLAPFSALKNLQELRLKSTAGLTLTSDLSALKELTQLRHLSLTSIKDLNKQNIEVIADLVNLESLDLGECTDFPKTFGPDILTKLTKLEKLRLEKGQGSCFTFEILEAVKDMPHLEQLELVNFDIKGGFDKALGACINIKKLLIIPTYISQSATTNHMVLGGVLRLRSTLSHFVWGVTLELLRVTELFVDQCEEPEKKDKRDKKAVSNGDSIPVLKPVPLLTDGKTEIPPAHEPPQVEILPLPNLQKLLLQSLPTTRVKILKIPFHATWRQSITDTVN